MMNLKIAMPVILLVCSFQTILGQDRSTPVKDLVGKKLVGKQHSVDKEPVDYVNPFIGTDKSSHRTVWESHGETFPGVLLPYGMVQITPDSYIYSNTKIHSFSFLNHHSGWSSKGSFHVMAYTSGANSLLSGALPVVSSFSHTREKSTPYYYSVMLDDYRIQASFAAAARAGYCRFAFPASKLSHILLSDLLEIKVVSPVQVAGKSNGYYFIARFSRPFGSWKADSASLTLRLDYFTEEGESVDLKIGFSANSYEAAEENLSREMPDWNFEKLCTNGRRIWNKQLGQIQVKGGTAEQREIFYTAFYHSLFTPGIISDEGEKNIRYTGLFPWDTYRSEHPLITLLDPVREGEMIASELGRYDQTGWLPTGNMLGNHNVEVILDGYSKGVRNFDIGKARRAIRKSLLEPPYARRDMAFYRQSGYVPANITNNVSQTLEFAYDDWAGARFLELTKGGGRKKLAADSLEEDILALRKGGGNYKNLYDPSTFFMRAKTDSGVWGKGGYCEGTEWTYTWYVPHDIRGLINLVGGKRKFTDRLAECFEDGHYAHDNEPPLHYAYLFDYTGEPWKTQQWARRIVEGSYSTDPGGLPGNDDLGALSSWYVFSAMGFYPVTPGLALYEIGSPLFDEVKIRLSNGKFFIIRAHLVSALNKYIQSARLNGRPYNLPTLSHGMILAGDTLDFDMGASPNKRWAADPRYAPPSMTTGHPLFTIGGLQISSYHAKANSPVEATVKVSNTSGAAGSVSLQLWMDGKPFQSVYALVNAGETKRISVPVTLYRAGVHLISLNRGRPLRILVGDTPPDLVYSDFKTPMPSLAFANESFPVSARVKNTGSARGSVLAVLYIDSKNAQQRPLVLEPGEEREVRFAVCFKEDGLHRLAIDKMPSAIVRVLGKGIAPGLDTSLLAGLSAVLMLNFEQGPGSGVKDLSGQGNDGIVKGSVKWVDGLFGKAIQTDASVGSYIDFPAGSALDTLRHSPELTLMAWVYPMDEENFSDIISKGEWNSLQLKGGNTVINFYTGGWEGHEAYTEVPENWNRHWHHIAGVTRPPFEELYVDGRLVATKRMEARNPHGETRLNDYSQRPWNIGRNANAPERVFKGLIDEVMIFEKALTPDQITALMLHIPGK
jgi:putative alpha-1,2-mannosidase